MPFRLLFSIIAAEKSGDRLPHLPGAINHPAVYILMTAATILSGTNAKWQTFDTIAA
jgi:hypothetical protein